MIYVKENSAYGFPLVLQYIVLHLDLQSIFVHSVRECSSFTLLHGAVQFSSTPGTEKKRPSFLHYILDSFCCILIDHKCIGLFLGYFCSTDLCICFFLPTPYHFDYCSFVVEPKVRETVILPTLFFFLKLVLGIWGFFVFP